MPATRVRDSAGEIDIRILPSLCPAAWTDRVIGVSSDRCARPQIQMIGATREMLHNLTLLQQDRGDAPRNAGGSPRSLRQTTRFRCNSVTNFLSSRPVRSAVPRIEGESRSWSVASTGWPYSSRPWPGWGRVREWAMRRATSPPGTSRPRRLKGLPAERQVRTISEAAGRPGPATRS